MADFIPDMAAAARSEEPPYLAALRRALAGHITAARAAKGMTKRELAARSGTAPDYVKRLEDAKVNATLETICNQRDEFLALVVGQSVGQAMPKPQRRAMAHTRPFMKRDRSIVACVTS